MKREKWRRRRAKKRQQQKNYKRERMGSNNNEGKDMSKSYEKTREEARVTERAGMQWLDYYISKVQHVTQYTKTPC